MTGGGYRRGQVGNQDEGVLIVALEGERLAVRAFYFFHNQIGVELDADGAGSFDRFEIDFCGGGDRLSNGVQSRGNVVMVRKKIRRLRNLGAEGRGEAAQKDQREDKIGLGTLRRRAIGPLSNVFNSAPMYIYRIPNPSVRVALDCAQESGDFIGRPFDGSRGAKEATHFFLTRESSFRLGFYFLPK